PGLGHCGSLPRDPAAAPPGLDASRCVDRHDLGARAEGGRQLARGPWLRHGQGDAQSARAAPHQIEEPHLAARRQHLRIVDQQQERHGAGLVDHAGEAGPRSLVVGLAERVEDAARERVRVRARIREAHDAEAFSEAGGEDTEQRAGDRRGAADHDHALLGIRGPAPELLEGPRSARVGADVRLPSLGGGLRARIGLRVVAHWLASLRAGRWPTLARLDRGTHRSACLTPACDRSMLASRVAPSADAPLVLAIDLGSSGIRVALVDAEGRAHGSAIEGLTMRLLPDGAAEEDPEEIWSALGRSVERALAQTPHARDRVAAILCGSQYSSLVPVDAHGRPLGPLVLYLDTRGARVSRELVRRSPELWKLWLERHGMPSPGGGSDSLAHWLWFQTERPDIHAKASAYLEPMDYVTARLSGRVAANICTVFPLLLTDNRRGSAGGWCEELIEASGVDRDKLPELIAPDAVVGELLPEHAKAWGLPRGVRVLSAINDTHALTFGTASHVGDRLGVSIGTTLVPTTLVDDMRADLAHFLLTQPAPIPDKHVLMAEGGLAGKALEFVLQGLVYAHDALGDHRRDDTYASLDAAVQSTEPGAGGVIFLPWLAGVWSPAGDAK